MIFERFTQRGSINDGRAMPLLAAEVPNIFSYRQLLLGTASVSTSRSKGKGAATVLDNLMGQEAVALYPPFRASAI